MRRIRAWFIVAMAFPFIVLCFCQFAYPMLSFSGWVTEGLTTLVLGIGLAAGLGVWLVRTAMRQRRRL